MTEISPWKIWACTSVLLALLATGTSARLRNSSPASLGEAEMPNRERPTPLMSGFRDAAQYEAYPSGFSFGLHNYSQPIAEQAIINHQVFMPRAPIFEDATYPDDDTLPDPAVQVASSFPIASTDIASVIAESDACLDSDLKADIAAIDEVKMSKNPYTDWLGNGATWGESGIVTDETDLTSPGEGSDAVLSQVVLDDYIVLDTAEPIDALIGVTNARTGIASPYALAYLSHEYDMNGSISIVPDQDTVARQLVIAAAVQQAQEEAGVNQGLDDGKANLGDIALPVVLHVRYEQAIAAQAQAALAQQAEDALNAQYTRRPLLNESQAGLSGVVPYY